MAGSFNHVLDESKSRYRGVSLLENMGDMHEAVEEMTFVLLSIVHESEDGRARIARALRDYYACVRGEQPWPDFMQPGIDR